MHTTLFFELFFYFKASYFFILSKINLMIQYTLKNIETVNQYLEFYIRFNFPFLIFNEVERKTYTL